MKQAHPPLPDTAQPFLQAAEYFNRTLFDGKLPPHTVSLQRGLRALSFFLPGRWRKTTGKTMHEIALNPTLFATRSLLAILQAIVQEQCHLWQFAHGSPSRSGYHNLEWANKMEALGFDVTVPGSLRRKTGQNVIISPSPQGAFVAACAAWTGHGPVIDWLDQGFVTEEIASASLHGTPLSPVARRQLLLPVSKAFPRLVSIIDTAYVIRKRKICYRCPLCQTNVWGKEGLALKCLQCSAQYAEVHPSTDGDCSANTAHASKTERAAAATSKRAISR